MAIKLLAVDMDGTCLNSKSKISEENLSWLRKARAQGIEIIPATGRTLTCIPYQLKEEKLFRYVITSNGAAVTDTETGEDIFRALISKATAIELLRECQGKGFGMTAHIGHEYLLQGKMLVALGRIQYGKDASYAKTLTALTGAVSHFAIGGMPDLTIWILCVLFTFLWARIAAVFANKASAKTLNRVTGVVLVAIGVVVMVFSFVS